MELYSFLHNWYGDYGCIWDEFPSPYGVSFILTLTKNILLKKNGSLKFPSPYGVSFILICGIYGRK